MALPLVQQKGHPWSKKKDPFCGWPSQSGLRQEDHSHFFFQVLVTLCPAQPSCGWPVPPSSTIIQNTAHPKLFKCITMVMMQALRQHNFPSKTKTVASGYSIRERAPLPGERRPRCNHAHESKQDQALGNAASRRISCSSRGGLRIFESPCSLLLSSPPLCLRLQQW